MGISPFNSSASGFHQQPLPSSSRVEGKGSIIIEEIVHQWDINGFVVSLIKEQDSLKYKTTDKDQKELCTNCIEISEEDNLEEMISYLKGSAVMVRDNGHVNFCSIFNTWKTAKKENEDISLVCGPEGLAWHVFNGDINRKYFLDFQKATIPSLHCHPETIALIEKIKTETFDNFPLLYRLIKDFKVRVISVKKLEENLNQEKSRALRIQKFYPFLSALTVDNQGLYPYLGLASAFLFRKSIISAVKDTNRLFGGGVFGAVMGLYVGKCVLQTTGSFLPALYWIKNSCSFVMPDTFCKKQESLQKRSLPLQDYLIEVEPISIPSQIDERIHVSKFTWAVTLVTNSGCFGNHAQIIIEGINDGFYNQDSARIGEAKEVEIGEKFIHLADFSPKIDYGLLSSDKLTYETRTETWMRSSEQVKKMLEAIEEKKYLSKGKRNPFNFGGKRSKLYKFNPEKFNFSGKVGDNCFSFLREKLQMIDIDLGESYLDLIATIAKNYTRYKEEYNRLPVQKLI